ncbi:MAG: sugar phosphate isomerase/epimerase [Anaerolineae bacterium]
MGEEKLVLGAAMRIEHLPEYAAWLIEDQRDLEIQDVVWPGTLNGDWKPLVQQAKSALDGYTGRLGIHGPFFGLTIAAPDPVIAAAVSDRLKRALEFCAELGGTHMVVHSPVQFLGTPFLSSTEPVMGQEMYLDAIRATMKDVIAMAESINCTIVIENIFDRIPALMRALVVALDSPYVRMSLDTGHAYVSYKEGGAPPDYWAKEASELLAHVHIQDTDGFADRHWAPGEGDIKWASLFRVLSRMQHKPRLILELADKHAIPAGAQYLANLGLAR